MLQYNRIAMHIANQVLEIPGNKRTSLKKLDELGLLKEVDVISTISEYRLPGHVIVHTLTISRVFTMNYTRDYKIKI